MENLNTSNIKRKSVLDTIDFHKYRNLFCEKKSLTNESSVESFFIDRFIQDLGYKDKNIKTKESIEKLTIAKGSKKFLYKPDYCLILNSNPKIIIDAKSPNENIMNWVEQCAHYSLLLNRKFKSVEYFIISNGIKTALFKWDEEKPIFELNFEDFYVGSLKYENIRRLISFDNMKKETKPIEQEKTISLKKINKEESQKLFLNCHKYIWNTEKRGPLSAFTEFTKLIFLKLWNDRILHETYPCDNEEEIINIPPLSNCFSVKWIESREKDLLNPINDIQFKNLIEHIQDNIDKNKKKRIFNSDEVIKLKPTTIKGVVKKLEKVDLLGIDEDLNGRLFETFLNATMRGEALGQYFTPRSIVILCSLMADLQVGSKHIDKILDASCGTGGFLIESLTIMRNKVRGNNSYSDEKKKELIDKISSQHIYGVDAASEPNLARIARINMYLHGDGGSHIYFGDGLEKNIQIDKSDPREIQLETEDMRMNIKSNSFDVVLTNPPFSMWYEINNESQKNIVKEYELLKIEGTNNFRNRLRGSAMFLERYYNLLKDGGKLISIIDETVLSSGQYSYVRDFIRDKFIIRAIISIHGDAFQMAKARVKTAIIYLEKKGDHNEKQPSTFMYSSIRIGIDDLPVTTNPARIKEARILAKEEINEILTQFNRYLNGENDVWLIPPERLTDRLDVKSCIPLNGRFINNWKKEGYDVLSLSSICKLTSEIIIPKEHLEKEFRILTITYDGRCKAEEIRKGKDINYKKMQVVHKGDLVFSEYNTFHGAIGYITEEFDGCLASGSYIVVKCIKEYDSLYLWSILRTTEIRAEFLTSAIGMGRQTVSWVKIKDIQVPFLSLLERNKIAQDILNSWEAEKKAKTNINDINKLLHNKFGVESDDSKKRFESAKPPR